MQITENDARHLVLCPACGSAKAYGLVVCWHCFKYSEDPYKYAGVDFTVWLDRQLATQEETR